MERLLMALLECGSMDLNKIENTGYDLGEIVDELQEEGIKPTMNAITNLIFIKGQDELKTTVDEAIQERKDWQLEIEGFNESKSEYDQLQEEINELKSLSPDNDMEWFCNCSDTSCRLSSNEDIYRKYLADQLEQIEENMGFDF